MLEPNRWRLCLRPPDHRRRGRDDLDGEELRHDSTSRDQEQDQHGGHFVQHRRTQRLGYADRVEYDLERSATRWRIVSQVFINKMCFDASETIIAKLFLPSQVLAFGSHGVSGPSARHLATRELDGGCALAVTHPVEAATLVLVNLSRLNFARSWIAKVRGFHFKVPIDQLKPEILKLQLWNRILKSLKIGSVVGRDGY